MKKFVLITMFLILGLTAYVFAASAPPLSYLQVYAVYSSNYPQYEYIQASQFTTVQDHGGALLYVVTKELGYGFSPLAKMNGISLKQLKSQAIVQNGVIVGYYRWWNASGQQKGQFTYTNKSTNYPWNTMSDWINIK